MASVRTMSALSLYVCSPDVDNVHINSQKKIATLSPPVYSDKGNVHIVSYSPKSPQVIL
jgi:hypothetical protein